MWRRNDIQIEKSINLMRGMLDNPFVRTMMCEKFRKIPTQDLIDYKYREMKDLLYSNIITNTIEEDPTVQKQMKDYKPIIVVNKTEINFPLHNKYSTVQYFDLFHGDEYPDCTIEPITNRIFIFCIISKKHGLVKERMRIPVVYLNDKQEVELLIKLYILDSAKSVVVDESNIDIVKKRLINPLNNKVHLNDPSLYNFLKKIYMDIKMKI
jgi:hypothetical protein